MLTIPKRRVFYEGCPLFYPFGIIPPYNALHGFNGLEPTDDDGTGLNVLKKILSCFLNNSKHKWDYLYLADSLPGLWGLEESPDNCH